MVINIPKQQALLFILFTYRKLHFFSTLYLINIKLHLVIYSIVLN